MRFAFGFVLGFWYTVSCLRGGGKGGFWFA